MKENTERKNLKVKGKKRKVNWSFGWNDKVVRSLSEPHKSIDKKNIKILTKTRENHI